MQTVFNFSNCPQGHYQSIVLQDAVNIEALHKQNHVELEAESWCNVEVHKKKGYYNNELAHDYAKWKQT